MNPEHWPQVKDLFLAAAELPPSQRTSFLADSPPHLREEVLSLLHHTGDSPLDTPALQHALQFLLDANLPPTIGPYRLLRPLGAGGMASVFLAERADGQFQKLVAIKILHSGIFGEDLHRRFLRERQLLASLDHPNIVRLLDGGILDDYRPYLIEDFIDGHPITQYATTHQLDAPAAVSLLAQVSAAVAYAHSQGVIHRDLKPANILVNSLGVPKLLDFGVAKISASSAPSADTQALYWTPAYASPEQARGLSVQSATDIYSLGLILFELLTHRPALQTAGMAPFDAARAVIEFTPNLSSLPRPIEPILAACLHKDPNRRPSAEDLTRSLQFLDWSPRLPLPTRRHALLTAAAIPPAAAALWYFRRPAPPRFVQIPGPDGEIAQPFPSPDGSQIVYRTSHRSDFRLVVLDRHRNTTRDLLTNHSNGVAQPSGPRWSPDGKFIAFISKQAKGWAAFVMPATGGSPLQVANLIDVALAWTHDSSALLFSRRSPNAPLILTRCSLSSRTETTLSQPPPDHWGDLWTAASPDGRHLVTVRYQASGHGDLCLLSSSGQFLRQLTHFNCRFHGVTFLPPTNQIVFSAARDGLFQLWHLDLDHPATPTLLSTPSGVNPVFPHASTPNLFAFTDQQDRFISYSGVINGPTNVSSQRPIAPPSDEAEWAVFRPDNAALAWSGISSGERGIWLQVHTESPRRIGTPLPHPAHELAWSPDNRHLAFTLSSPKTQIWIVDTHTGNRRPLLPSTSNQSRPSWSPDNKSIFFLSDHEGLRRFYRAPWPTLDQLTPVTPTAIDGFPSPTGDSFLFLANDQSPLLEISPSSPIPRPVPNLPPLRKGHWAVVPNAIVFLDDYKGNLARVDLLDWNSKSRSRFTGLPEWRPALIPGLALSPDRRVIIWSVPTRRESAWLREGPI